MACLYNKHQAHGGLFQFHGSLCIGKLRAVDDVGPMNEVVEIGHRVIENGPCHVRDELSAGFVTRIVELTTASIVTKMGFVLRRKKCTLVMIEPPGQLVGC